MQVCDAWTSLPFAVEKNDHRPLIVVGITHPQTCLVLPGRLQALKAAGFRVVLISSPGALLERTAKQVGVEAWTIPIQRGMAPFADLVSLIRLWRAIRRLRPDMTEFSTPKAGLLGNLAAMVCRVPARVYMLRGLRLETLTGPKRWLLLAAERIASACAHRVVCNSGSLRAKALELGIAPWSKLQLIGNGSSNGVDVERFSPGRGFIRKKLGIPRDVPVVGFVGRVTRDKGVPELVEAFEEILRATPSARLVIVGWFDESEDRVSDAVRQRIESHPRIVFTGFVGDAAPYYRAMDMLVLPTWREGFPNAVLEAASTGIPVITTFSTGSRDAVLPEVTGLLIPAGYPQAISEAVLRLIRNPDERCRMGQAGRKWVIEQFVNGHVLGLTVNFYKRLLMATTRQDAVTLPAAFSQTL